MSILTLNRLNHWMLRSRSQDPTVWVQENFLGNIGQPLNNFIPVSFPVQHIHPNIPKKPAGRENAGGGLNHPRTSAGALLALFTLVDSLQTSDNCLVGIYSMNWLRGKITGKPYIWWESRRFPVYIFPETNPLIYDGIWLAIVDHLIRKMTIWVAQCATIHSPRRWRCALPKNIILCGMETTQQKPENLWKSQNQKSTWTIFRMIPLYPDGIPDVPHRWSLLWARPCVENGSKLQTKWDDRFGQNVLIWLVVYLPLWKIWKSVGIMTFPIYGKIKHVPNHQPVMYEPSHFRVFFVVQVPKPNNHSHQPPLGHNWGLYPGSARPFSQWLAHSSLDWSEPISGWNRLWLPKMGHCAAQCPQTRGL